MKSSTAGRGRSLLLSIMLLSFCMLLQASAKQSVIGSSSPVRVEVTASGLPSKKLPQEDFSKPKESQQQRTLSEFATRDSRQGFIRQVYSILSAQMLSTILVVGYIMKTPSAGVFLREHFKVCCMGSLVGSLGIVGVLTLSNLRYRVPYNLFLLAVYTFLQSISLGVFSLMVDPQTVIVGAMHTLTALIAITSYSFMNEAYDLSLLGNALLTASATLLCGSIVQMFANIPLFDNILSGVWAILFAVYLAYDTRLIIGGKHQKKMYGQNDYIVAALSVYQDVISLFIRIVKLLDGNKKNRGAGRKK